MVIAAKSKALLALRFQRHFSDYFQPITNQSPKKVLKKS